MFLKKIVNLLLYSNIWIALGGSAAVFSTQLLLLETVLLDSYAIFVFFATWFIYAAHRIVGFKKVKNFQEIGRYDIIYTYKQHIIIYTVLAGIGTLVTAFFLPWSIILLLAVPGIFSLAYVLPILGKGKRLRDLSFLKIFLIALVWSWVTVIVPYHLYAPSSGKIVFLAIERFLFIFAITIPFDIRDLDIDHRSKVNTIPAWLGIYKSKQLALVLALLAALSFFFFVLENEIGKYGIAYLLNTALTMILIARASPQKSDYYFTGILDGLIICQSLSLFLVYLI